MKRILMVLAVVLILPGSLLANTLAWWPIDEGSGDTVYDASGNSHHGVIHGATWVPGYCNGYALEFDGADDYVDCFVIQPYLTTSFTVEIVFKVNETGENGNWFFSTGGSDPSQWTAIKFHIESSGVLTCQIQFTGGTPGPVVVASPTVVNDGEWHHAALVYDNANLKLYLDGGSTPVAEAPATGTIVQQNHHTYIGRYDWDPWQPTAFSGAIDEVRISSTALSPDQFLEFPCSTDSAFTSSDVVCLASHLMKVTLTVHNHDTLSAMTIPLLATNDCPTLVTPDSVTFWGTRIEDWEGKNVIINGDTVVLGLIADMGEGTPPLPPGEGPIAYVYFSIPCDPENVYDSCSIAWDTTTVQPEDQGLLFVDNHENEFVPYFEPGTTLVALYRPGDVNGNCTINVGDVVYLISYLFRGGPEPRPPDAADVNGDCAVDIGDVVYLVNYLYKSGPPPVCGCASHPELAGGCKGCVGTNALRKTAGSAEVRLSNREVPSPGEKFVEVDASFSTCVAGVQLELSYDAQEIESIIPELTDRSQDMKLFFGAADGIVKIGVVDLTGEHVVRAGEGPLVRLRLAGASCSSLELEKAILVDEEAAPLSVAILPKEDGEEVAPRDFILSQNHPNPFNPETGISYTLTEAAKVRLTVYNMLGQKVKTLVNEYQAAGHNTISWDGTDEGGNGAASGIYFYRIKAGEFEDTKKMILMK